MNRKIEQVKKKRTQKAQEEALIEKQIQGQDRLKDAVDSLNELLNGQEQYDFDKLHNQLVEIDKRLDLAPHFKSLEESIKSTSHKVTPKTKIEGFSELLRAVKTNKPLPTKVDLSKLEKAIVDIQQRIEDNSKPIDQAPESYQPVRRVVKMGNRLIYDDILTPSAGTGGGGGGGTTDGLTDEQLRDSPVPVSGTVNTGASTPFVNLSADIGVDTIKSGAGGLTSIQAVNTNTTDCIVVFYDISGSVTVGVSAISYILFVPKGDGTNYGASSIEFPNPINFANAIKYAVVTTAFADPTNDLVIIGSYI